ncbi:MAG: transcriptional repressor [Thermoflavifilum sp.]|nr:transcriptional repressor [Thermoflavifilum sp.]MCL6513714.1 transcriptional repressor [Alicyclobacillus sp.]
MDPGKLNVVAMLKQAGLRVTPQREAILQYLVDTGGHATVEEIYQGVQPCFPHMSVSTVYNTVKHLAQVGLIKEIHVGDGPSRFDMNVRPHHHLICRKCGILFDFYIDEPPRFHLPPEAQGFQIEDYHVEVQGICPACRAASGE